MANYDTPGLTYDSGVFYDDASVPPTTRKHMAKVKLNIDRLADEQLVQRATDYKTALTGNTNFTTPIPTLVAMGTRITTAQAKLSAFNTAQQAAKQATTEKNAAMDDLRAGMNDWGSYVQLTSGGDPAKIQSAGMDVKASSAPTVTPEQAANLSLTAGDSAGELDLQWDPTNGANRYEAQMCAAMEFASGVTNLPSVTKSKTVATGLASGSRMFARVRALNAAGPGAWSDVASKIVP